MPVLLYIAFRNKANTKPKEKLFPKCMFQDLIIFVRIFCYYYTWCNWDLDTPMYFLRSTKEEQLPLQIRLLIVPNPVEVRNKEYIIFD